MQPAAEVKAALVICNGHCLGCICYFRIINSAGKSCWPAPWGIQYRIDLISAFVLVLITAIASITLLASRQLVENEIDAGKHALFYTAFLLCFTGLLGIVATGDAFNVFVFLEISSLASYAMIAMGDDRKALTASYEYSHSIL